MTDSRKPTAGGYDAEHALFRDQVQRYQRPIFGFLSRFGFPAEVVEELAQDTFLRAWRARHSVDPEKGAYSTWLFRIARNVALNEIERATSRINEQAEVNIEWIPTIETAQSKAELNESMGRLISLLTRLNDQEREAIALAYVQELTTQEAAAIVGCTEGAFRTRLSRARKRLLEHWENNEKTN